MGNAFVPQLDDRSNALALLCGRLLQELDRADAERERARCDAYDQNQPGCPGLVPTSQAEGCDGERVWELRRLLAWAGGTVADVARALEAYGADLDKNARELLRDELEALDADLTTLNVQLADPVDWDSEFTWLVAEGAAPFDEVAGDEDEQDDEAQDDV